MPANQPPPLIVSGILADRAECRVALGGAYLLMFELLRPYSTTRYRVVRQYGHDQSGACACHKRAGQLRRGYVVTVHASDQRVLRHDAQRTLVELVGVDFIYCPDTDLQLESRHTAQADA